VWGCSQVWPEDVQYLCLRRLRVTWEIQSVPSVRLARIGSRAEGAQWQWQRRRLAVRLQQRRTMSRSWYGRSVR
jgi:hypothetical protein